jgi:adenosylmethionine-8-amino-7-oxononanoate aminotransferase
MAPTSLLHPFARPTTEDFITIVRGDGAAVFDQHGNRYVDGLASLWCCNAGHANPRSSTPSPPSSAHSTPTTCSTSSPTNPPKPSPSPSPPPPLSPIPSNRDHLPSRVRTLLDRGFITAARGVGAIWAVDVAAGLDLQTVRAKLLACGVIARPIGAATVASCPPLVITADDLDRCTTSLEAAIRSANGHA